MGADEIMNAVGNNTSHLDAAKKGNQELKNFHQGNYEYQKGKGWQLKESKLNAIIAESVKRVLDSLNK